MKTADIPHLQKEKPVADVRASADVPAKQDRAANESKAADKPATRGGLMSAAESSNPDVHQLLAKRQNIIDGYELVEDDAAAKEAKQKRREEGRKLLDEVDEQLGELGYTAK